MGYCGIVLLLSWLGCAAERVRAALRGSHGCITLHAAGLDVEPAP
jgi:hypothetical protein